MYYELIIKARERERETLIWSLKRIMEANLQSFEAPKNKNNGGTSATPLAKMGVAGYPHGGQRDGLTTPLLSFQIFFKKFLNTFIFFLKFYFFQFFNSLLIFKVFYFLFFIFFYIMTHVYSQELTYVYSQELTHVQPLVFGRKN